MNMSGRILNVIFKFNVSGDDYVEAVSPLAEDVSQVAGLQWKIWIFNEEEREAGGIHLFEDEDACNAYLGSPLVATITGHPALSDFSAKQFDVMDEQTATTRGPVGTMAHS
jgi:hypothetical protein